MKGGIKPYIKKAICRGACPFRNWSWMFTLCEDNNHDLYLKIDLVYDSEENLTEIFKSLRGTQDSEAGVKDISFTEKARVDGVGLSTLGKVIAKMVDMKQERIASSEWAWSLYKDPENDDALAVIVKMHATYADEWRDVLAAAADAHDIDYERRGG